MERLVEYFAVVGYDFDNEDKDSTLRGKVITRVPEYDWKDFPFTHGIELFCQPGGWFLVHDRQPPTFHVAILTDAEGKQCFCAVHSFPEPVRPKSPQHKAKARSDSLSNGPGKDGDAIDDHVDDAMCKVENGEDDPDNTNNDSIKNGDNKDTYSIKCLVLISRVKDFKVLKNCLGLIYTVYIEGLTMSLENIVAKLLLVKVPPAGSSCLRFSIGAADKQALQMPQTMSLPLTRSSVTMLLRQLGILNVLNILCAALVDQKLLFYSCSYNRLTEACNALVALMYPFMYSYPYIPILPKHLLECTSSPTPFLIGVHSSFKNNLQELLDVVTVDLDGGVISIPECVTIPMIPEPYYTSVVESLTKVLCPDLVVADYAYPPDHTKSSEPERLDKEIRAIFLRLFGQLLMGYRSSLQVCRIHPRPVIRFQTEQYLLSRGFDVITPMSNEFVPKLLQSQAFSLFVQENGPPFRKLHLFDEIVAKMRDRIQGDISNVHQALKNVKEIASDLYMNENPNHIPLSERIPKPNEGSLRRPPKASFPKLSVTAIQTFMEENRSSSERSNVKRKSEQKSKRVPEGSRSGSLTSWSATLTSSSRRLEVLKNCLSFIFESKTLEIKKIFQAVLRALKSRVARSNLVQELIVYSKTHPQLDNQQFDYIARLINNALQDSSGQLDEFTIAADVLPVTTTFYRKLCPTVMQFVYTVVQEHPVWSSSAFWENAFFDDIQNAIQKLYMTKLEKSKARVRMSPSRATPLTATRDKRSGTVKRDNQLCMEIAAYELQHWEGRSPSQQEEDIGSEEGVVFSQAMHNAQRMVFMLVPLDSTRNNRVKFLRVGGGEESSSNSYFTNSIAESDAGSVDGESGFDESQDNSGDVSAAVSKFVSKFVDRVCTEAYISTEHTKTLINKVPMLVHMQMESLQDVCKESKRLPPIKKPKLLQPSLLDGEERIFKEGVRVYLAPDGRGTAVGENIGGPALLPAEGALFVTTYRVIFIGTPCDALAAEQVVIRSFPVSSLFKIKMFSVNDVPHVHDIDSSLTHGVQLRSSTFQFLLLAFDEEVTSEERERLQSELHNLRYPRTIEGAFAISGANKFFASRANQAKGQMRTKSDSVSSTSTINPNRIGGAKTFIKQAKRKAGLNKGNRISRFISPDTKSRTLYYPVGAGQAAGSSSTLGRMPVINETMTKTLSDKDTINRLVQRSSETEYVRLGLINKHDNKYRFSRINRMFAVCKTYPMCVIVPMKMTDDQVKSIAHCHHQGRFPAIVWLHPSTKAVLLHSSAIRSRTANSLFKHGQSAPMLSDEGTVGSSSEEERFLLNIASLAPPNGRPLSSVFHIDSTSMSSLSSNDEEMKLSPASGLARGPGAHMSQSVRNPKGKKWGTFGRSNGKAIGEQMSKTPILNRRTNVHQNGSATIAQSLSTQDLSTQAQLYVLGDKAQLKSMRHEQQGKILFIPLELPEPKQIRISYKSLLKSCLPADLPPVTNSSAQEKQQGQESSHGYLKGVQDSGWLEQVSMLLRAAGVVVDVMDARGASVVLAIEDGCDSVPQVSSLAQLLMDPYYRTVEGFQVLVQKEWLSFGHRFSHRNRFNHIESSGFTPVFLQFLDTVYQVHAQFPMSFEFNSTFLELLAYHSVSNRFTTFLLDSDYERLEADILFEKSDRRRSPGRHSLTSTGSTLSGGSVSSPSSPGPKSPTKCLWTYIALCHKRSPVFLNPLFAPGHVINQVLRPVSALSRLKIWPYYFCESLSEGTTYDGLLGELSSGTSHNEHEATETSDVWGGATARRVINGCYDNVSDAQTDSIKTLLQQIQRLNSELDPNNEGWREAWKALDSSNAPDKVNVSPETRKAHRDISSLHALQTEDIIVKGLDFFQNQQVLPFRPRSKTTTESSPRRLGAPMLMRSVIREESISSEAGFDSDTLTPQNSVREKFDTVSLYDQFQTNSQEVRTYEGALWKRGAYIKGWKQRYFVLDTTKHELRQYENKGDSVCKNVIALKDLESVQLIEPISGAPKEVDENAFLEVRVSKRQYHFIAETPEAAKHWVDNLQAALQ